MGQLKKQQLLEQASQLLGRGGIAAGLGVSETQLQAWLDGREVMPDSKLAVLASVLLRSSRPSPPVTARK